MKIASQDPAKFRRAHRSEAVILFTVANQMFAISADAVQEIRSTDSLGAGATGVQSALRPSERRKSVPSSTPSARASRTIRS